MEEITFTAEERAILVAKLIDYFDKVLGIELVRFDAEPLLRFLSVELGPYYYNRGLYDAQHALEDRLDIIRAAILDQERPTEFRR